MSDLSRMDALQPYSQDEISKFGGEEAFLKTSWNRTKVVGQSPVWTIPWFEDTRLLFYRRDYLELLNPGACQAVKVRWFYRAWGLGYEGAGCDFLTKDWESIAFNKPEALQGIREYFSLARYLVPEAQGKIDTEFDNIYSFGKAAITIRGPCLLRDDPIGQAIENTGYTSPPGIPHIGGAHLAIWHHTLNKQAVLDLVELD